MLTTSENSKPVISCIYINYHSAELLERSLRGLFAHEKTVPFEVIIVNNDEQEKEDIEALKQNYPVQIFEAFHNPGFGTAANVGAKKASGNILFFINPDTEWRESFFHPIEKKMQDDISLGAVGIQMVSSEGVPETNSAGKCFVFPNIFHSSKKKPDTIEWLSGGALFVSQKAFQEAGGFDERFFMYFEDMDLCYRLQENGYTLQLATKHQITHLGGKSHSTKRSQKNIYDQSLYRYTKKHWPFFQYLLFRIMHPCYRFLFPYGRS